MIDIISLLSCDGYIICNKTLIKKFNADCAILVGELCAEYSYYKNLGQLDSDGSFYSTRDNIEQNTGLNDYAQRKAIKMLSEAKILTVTKKGLPAKNHYKLNASQLLSLFTTGDTELEAPEIKPLDINNNKQIIITKNNTDISSDISETDSSEVNLEFGKSKPKKLNLYQQCLAIINDYTEDTNIRKMLIDYLDLLLEKMRNEHKVLYANQFKGMLKHLCDLVASKEGKLEDIISQSISKGYIGFFPANNNNYIQQKQQGYRLPPQKKAKFEDLARDKNGNFIVY